MEKRHFGGRGHGYKIANLWHEVHENESDEPVFDNQFMSYTTLSSDNHYYYCDLQLNLSGYMDVEVTNDSMDYPNWTRERSVYAWSSETPIAIPKWVIEDGSFLPMYFASYVIDGGKFKRKFNNNWYYANIVDHSKSNIFIKYFSNPRSYSKWWHWWNNRWYCDWDWHGWLFWYETRKLNSMYDKDDLYMNNSKNITDYFTIINKSNEFKDNIECIDLLNDRLKDYPDMLSAVYKKSSPAISAVLFKKSNGYVSYDGMNYILPTSGYSDNSTHWHIRFTNYDKMNYYWHVSNETCDTYPLSCSYYGLLSGDLEIGEIDFESLSGME